MDFVLSYQAQHILIWISELLAINTYVMDVIVTKEMAP